MTLPRIRKIALLPVSLLILPLVASFFSSEVRWSAMDYLIMGTMLLTVGVLIDLAQQHIKTRGTRLLVILGTLLLFVILWAEMAVGIFGSPLAGS